jgi:hypothetical protein
MLLIVLAVILTPVLIFVVWNACIGFKEGMQRAKLTDEEKQEFVDYIYGRLDGTVLKNAIVFHPKMRIVEPMPTKTVQDQVPSSLPCNQQFGLRLFEP